MTKRFALLISLLVCGLAFAQQPPDPAPEPDPGAAAVPAAPALPPPAPDRGPGGPGGPPGMAGFHGPAMGKWWKDSNLVRELDVSDAQVRQIEQIFQDHRLDLIDLRANLEKQEAILEPLIDADNPDEAKVEAQFDKVAAARANLEKSNARMLLAIRRVLTVDQWKKLQARTRDRNFDYRGPRAPRPPRQPGV